MSVSREIAFRELQGVGDAALGEWEERGTAFHLRRRLTVREMAQGGIVAVCDVRGTDEGRLRVARMRPFLPPQMAGIADEALP